MRHNNHKCLWLKFCQVRFLYDYIDSKVFADFYDDNNLTIGGVDSYGYDAANDLTYMILEAEAHVHLPEPNLQLRLHKNTPEKLIRCALEVLRLGSGNPQIVNDDVIIPSLMSRGVSLKEKLIALYPDIYFIIVSDHGFDLITGMHSTYAFYSTNIPLGPVPQKIIDFYSLLISLANTK